MFSDFIEFKNELVEKFDPNKVFKRIKKRHGKTVAHQATHKAILDIAKEKKDKLEYDKLMEQWTCRE